MADKKLNEKLDKILENQEKILSNEEKILKEEGHIEELEQEALNEEHMQSQSEEDAMEELHKLEKDLKDSLKSHPMKKVTQRDLIKGFLGASFGILGHFAFSKAADIAIGLSIWRATVLYFVAFVVIIAMLYYAGFRKIEKRVILKFMPLRASILYGVSIFTILLINLLFGKIHYPFTFTEIYTLVGASIILAVLGAGTADLLGRNE
jgi:uncharacterized membrane protein